MLFGMASYRTWLALCLHYASYCMSLCFWVLLPFCDADGWPWDLISEESYWLVLASCSQRWKKTETRWTFVGFLSSQSVPSLSQVSIQYWYPNLAKSCKIKKSTDVSQASLLYIFQNDLVIVGEGRAVSAMQSFAKTLVHTGHVQYDEAIYIQLAGYFSLKSRHACTSTEECRSMLMLRCFALVWSRICSGVARISQCQQLVSWGGISWALESCIADLRWAGHCSLGTQIWEPGRTFAAWRKRLLAFAPFQLQYKAWSAF